MSPEGEVVERIFDKLNLVAAGEADDAMMLTCVAFAGSLLNKVRPMDERRAAWVLMTHILSEMSHLKFPKKKKAKLHSIVGGKT